MCGDGNCRPNSFRPISGWTESEADEFLLFRPSAHGKSPYYLPFRLNCSAGMDIKSTSHICRPIGPGRHSLPQVAFRNLTLSGNIMNKERKKESDRQTDRYFIDRNKNHYRLICHSNKRDICTCIYKNASLLKSYMTIYMV